MRVLALDSSTLDLSLAVAEGQPGGWQILTEARHPPGTNHSVLLPRVLDEVLAAAGVKRGELEALVVGLGPGSFTGLRIGLACAKGLAYAQHLPVVGVSSLEAMALEAQAGEALLVPALDARRSELYVGLFRRVGARVEAIEPRLALTPAALIERLQGQGPVCLFGQGEAVYRAELEAGLRYHRDGPAAPSARFLLDLVTAIPAYRAADAFALEPYYVRAPEQEWTLKPKQPRPPPMPRSKAPRHPRG
jgi:tRNA threonylcarbamoyladenosine biosynthesis protein TsaB